MTVKNEPMTLGFILSSLILALPGFLPSLQLYYLFYGWGWIEAGWAYRVLFYSLLGVTVVWIFICALGVYDSRFGLISRGVFVLMVAAEVLSFFSLVPVPIFLRALLVALFVPLSVPFVVSFLSK